MPTVNMTARWVESVPSAGIGKQIDYFDQKQPGLVLRVGSSERKTWCVVYRVRGDARKRRMTLGPYPVFSLATARDKAKEIVIAGIKGDDPAGEKRRDKAATTFQELAAAYLERYASAKRSGHEDARMLRKDVLPEWGSRKAMDIKRRDVIALLDRIADRGAGISANRTLAVVRKVFNWGIGRDLIEGNPCLQVQRPARENRRDRVLNEGEILALWQALDSASMGHATRQAIRLILVTGQRPGEVVAAEWSEMERVGGWWSIPAEKSKNRLPHRVPLTSAALELLTSLPETSNFLFPSPRKGRHVPTQALAHAMFKMRSGLSIERVTPHDLRRTAASHMASAGASRIVISKILNHAEPGVTAVYDRHGYDAEKRQAMEKWGRKLKAILGAPKDNVVRIG